MSDEDRKMRLIQVGKVKEVYEVSGTEELEFHFTDKISVFDKVIPSMIPRKGESLNRTSAHWFNMGEELGIKSHFIRTTGPDTMRVKRVAVERDMKKITNDSTSILIPLEIIARYYVAGSLLDRLKKGRVRAESVGFPSGHVPKYGEPLPQPLIEATTKLEEVDRPLTDSEAVELAKLSKDEWDQIIEAVNKIDDVINREVMKRGLIHVDGKKEFGFDSERNIMLIDTFGTADEDRFWDVESYENGKLVELSKETVRQIYRNSGYHEKLMSAREAGASKNDEPPIPALTREEIDMVSKLYGDLYERLTGGKF
ncbi:MAG: phosphoribosylaminoimidazolesuccinocarboxamide synthase [Thermoplasmatota archaeon]